MPNEPHVDADNERLSVTVQASGSKAPILVAPSSLGASTDGQPASALEGLDRRIAEASPYEALEWVRIRGEIVKQNAFVSDRIHLQKLERIQLFAKIGISALAIAVGTGLAYADFGLPAFLCLGAGLYGLAPAFIDKFANRIFGGERDKT